MIEHIAESQITVKKCKVSPDQRMAAKALLLAHFPSMLNAGQLIIHFGPGRNPIFAELQERHDTPTQQLQRTG